MTNLYSVSYNTNNSTGGTTPPTQSATSDSTNYTFRAPTAEEYGLARTGYIFMGWAENPNAPIQDYIGGATIELSSTSPQKTLYAMWGKEYDIKFGLGDGILGSAPSTIEKVLFANFPYTYTPKTAPAAIYKPGYAANGWNEVTFTASNPSPTATPTWRAVYNGITTMQGMTSTICNNAAQHDPTILTDSRDGKNYWVNKLKDDDCWMTQNLALDLEGRTLTDKDSDVSNNWNEASNIASGFWDSSIGSNGIRWYHSDIGNGHSSYGNYYSWGAATAGTGNSITSTNGNDYPAEASGSICPKGWRLPIGYKKNGSTNITPTTDKSFAKLTKTYGIEDNGAGSTALKADPLYFVYSGIIYRSKLENTDSHGYYWSSTASNETRAYDLYFYSSSANPSNNYYRYSGFPVRCVAR